MKQIHFIRNWLSQHGLHLRVLLGIVIPIVIVIGAFSYIDYTRRSENTITTLSMFSSHIGEVIQNDLRHQMLESDFEGLQNLLLTIGELEGVHAVHLLNVDGEIIFSSNLDWVGTQVDIKQAECISCHDFDVPERPTSLVVSLSGGERVFRSAQIIDNDPDCQDCHRTDNVHLGLLLTDLAVAPYEATLLRDTYDHFLWWSTALLLTLIVVGLVFNRFILQRLNAFGRQITNIGERQAFTKLVDQPRDEIGRIAAAVNTMAKQIEDREAENAALSNNLRAQNELRGQLLNRLITAQEKERVRVAHDLHDDLGQSMTGLALHIQALKSMIAKNPDLAAGRITEIETVIQETTEKMYSMILDLRPSVLDDLGLIPALRAHAERVLSSTRIDFSLQNESQIERLPAIIETTLYRVFQEALTNIIKHAHASRVDIILRQVDGFVEGEVADNGSGFDLESVDLSGESPRGLGLLGMKERVGLIGGTFFITSTPGRGTRILVRIKLDSHPA